MSPKRKFPKLVICFLFFFLSEGSYAQIRTVDLSQMRPAYLVISTGVQPSTFRDFATSPLFYKGNPIYLALSHLDLDAKRTSSFQLSYTYGDFTDDYAQSKTVSSVNIFTMNYVERFQLKRFSSSKFNLKVGGQFNATTNIRDNQALGNNSKGFEGIATLFGSVKGTMTVSKKGNKPARKLAFGLNLGLLNSNFRNGFIYTRESPLLNQDEITDGYRFRFFSGYRINSTMDYTIWLKNKNAIKLAYEWDVYKTGNDLDEFEMASHLLRISLFFNLK